jgi:hypothetical protein
VSEDNKIRTIGTNFNLRDTKGGSDALILVVSAKVVD